MELIRRGDRSRKVADIQARLRALGFGIDDELGSFGDETERALKTFQQRRGTLVDGIVGPHTWSELVAAQWRLGDRVLYLKQPLMRGDDVDALQQRLNAIGFDAGRQDGIYGPDTDRATRVFQREYGIWEDGLFGPESYAALVGLRADRAATAAALREELRIATSGGLRNNLVVLDPGHGGLDRGTRGVGGLWEADICWDIATLIADRLARVGARPRFTRTEIEAPDVTERALRANELEADLFISLHLNANDEPKANGAATFYFPTSKAGEVLADRVQSELVIAGADDCRSHGRSFPILKETRMPAVLVEPGFITNPVDEQRLEDPDHRRRLADAIARAVERYYESN